MATAKTQIGKRSLMENMGAQLIGRKPVSLKNKRKSELMRAAQSLENNGYVNIGNTVNSSDLARAVLIGNGIEAVNNLDDTNGNEYSLMLKPDNNYEKIGMEDLDVYRRALVTPLQTSINIRALKPGEIDIPGANKDDATIFIQDPDLTENQKQIFIQNTNSINENSPDPVQELEVAVTVQAESSGCKISYTPPNDGATGLENNSGNNGNSGKFVVIQKL